MSEIRKVFKYALKIGGITNLKLPKGAQALHVDVQGSLPQLWALVDPEAEKQKRCFLFVATGQPIERADLRHVSTFMMDGGKFVFHVFEVLSL